MDSETIWTSILIPILIGPLFLLLKMIYDRYINQLNEKKLLIFNEKKKELKDKLDNFYWPLYLKLLCIYQLNYNLPENSDEGSSSSSGSESGSSDDEIYDKRLKCIGYFKDNNHFICNKYISKQNKYMLCKKCNRKCNKLNINKKNNKQLLLKTLKIVTTLKIENDNDINNIMITIPDNHESELELEYDNEYDNEYDITKNISPDITGHGVGVVNDLPHTSLNISQEALNGLEKQLSIYYLDCDNIIQNNINICNPTNKLGKQLIKFVKYVNVRSIINSQQFNYEPKQFGCKNNINKLISLVEVLLYSIKEEYDKLISDGPYEHII